MPFSRCTHWGSVWLGNLPVMECSGLDSNQAFLIQSPHFPPSLAQLISRPAAWSVTLQGRGSSLGVIFHVGPCRRKSRSLRPVSLTKEKVVKGLGQGQEDGTQHCRLRKRGKARLWWRGQGQGLSRRTRLHFSVYAHLHLPGTNWDECTCV